MRTDEHSPTRLAQEVSRLEAHRNRLADRLVVVEALNTELVATLRELLRINDPCRAETIEHARAVLTRAEAA